MQLPKINFSSLGAGILHGVIFYCACLIICAIFDSIFDFSREVKSFLIDTSAMLALVFAACVAVSADLAAITRLKRIFSPALVMILVIIGGLYSYAFMQSGRGGGGGSTTPFITAAQITEQPADVRSALSRMIIAGTLPEKLTFTGAATSNDVFDRDHGGGGATDIPPPYAACSPPCNDTGWTYLTAAKKDYGWYVHGVGTSATDIIAYLPNITPKVCSMIQKGLGYASLTPPEQAGESFSPAKPGTYSKNGNAATIKSEDNTLDGQEFGCFYNHFSPFGGSRLSFYGVLHAQ